MDDNFENIEENNKLLNNQNEDIIQLSKKSKVAENSAVPYFLSTISNLLSFSNTFKLSNATGAAPELPLLPGIIIKQFGNLLLPIENDQCQKLVSFFDTNSIIENTQIQFQNPDWHTGLTKFIDRILKELNIKLKIEAKFDKLLLHSSSNTSIASNNDLNTFGTLVIQLPSTHKGGEILLQSKNEPPTIYDFGQATNKSPFQLHFALFSSDTEAELLEIENGCTIKLIYSLKLADENEFSIINCSLVEKVACALKTLNSSQNFVGLLLENFYEAPLGSLNELKGNDLNRFELLRNANEQLMEKEKIEFCLIECSIFENKSILKNKNTNKKYVIRLGKWFDASLSEVFDLHEDKDSSAVFSHFIDLEPNKEKKKLDKIDLNNNKKSLVLAFFPKRLNVEVYSKINLNYAIEIFYKDFDSTAKSEVFLHLANIINKLNQRKNGSGNVAVSRQCETLLLEVLTKIKEINLVKLFLDYLPRINEEHLDYIVALIAQYGFNFLKESIKRLLKLSNNYSLSIRCKLVKKLFDTGNEKIALECLNLFILPIFDNWEVLKEIREPQFKSNSSNESEDSLSNEAKFDKRCCELIDTLSLFPNEVTSEYFNKFGEIMLKILGEYSSKVIVDRLRMNFDEMKNYNSMLMLIEKRIVWLEMKIKNIDMVDLKMYGSIPGHPDVEMFLKSVKKELLYDYNFESREACDNFINRYDGLKETYSISITKFGAGRHKSLLIKKTMRMFERDKCELESYKLELHELINLRK